MLDKDVVTRGLRFVFWGGLVCVLDIKINNFDLLNDVVGMLLITLGVFGLGKQEGGESYRKAMAFVKPVAVVSTLVTLLEQGGVSLGVAGHVISMLTLAGIYVFCRAMITLANHHGLLKSAASWRMTSVLFLVIYIVPLGTLSVMILAAHITGDSFNVNVGNPALGILLIGVFFIPLIHLFISTSRMRNEVDSSGPDSGTLDAAFQDQG